MACTKTRIMSIIICFILIIHEVTDFGVYIMNFPILLAIIIWTLKNLNSLISNRQRYCTCMVVVNVFCFLENFQMGISSGQQLIMVEVHMIGKKTIIPWVFVHVLQFQPWFSSQLARPRNFNYYCSSITVFQIVRRCPIDLIIFCRIFLYFTFSIQIFISCLKFFH